MSTKDGMIAMVKIGSRLRVLEVRRMKVMNFLAQLEHQRQQPFYVGSAEQKRSVLEAYEGLMIKVSLKLVKIDAIKQNILNMMADPDFIKSMGLTPTLRKPEQNESFSVGWPMPEKADS